MMATTHALAGVALAVVVSLFVPEAGGLPVMAAAVGGFFPDFDLTGDHRKTLHFPVYYSVAAAAAGVVAAVVTTPVTLAVALFLAAAALHSVMDAAGGGLEPRPWLGQGERAVYNHASGRWVPPKRWIRYDGAPEDLVLGGVLAVPGLLLLGDTAQTAIVGALAVSVVYTALRKPLVALADRVVPQIPQDVFDRLPRRVSSFIAAYRGGGDSHGPTE
jgi:hypothetical protein